MTEACRWVKDNAGHAKPVLVAYPLSLIGRGFIGTLSNFQRMAHRSATRGASILRLLMR